jgi:hypothetical protein
MTTFTPEPRVVNRRRFVRIPANCKVVASKILFSAKGDNKLWGEARNIGAGGILFVCEKSSCMDDMLKVTVTIPGWREHHPQTADGPTDTHNSSFTAVCRVLRSKKLPLGGCELAAKFVNIYEDDMTALQRFIEAEAERLGVDDSDPAER